MSPSSHRSTSALVILAAGLAVAGCAPAADAPRSAAVMCVPGNAGLTLAEGFCATLFADLATPRARHIVVRRNGDVFVAAYAPRGDSVNGGVWAMRDTDADGKADQIERFGPDRGGSGIALSGDNLWFATDDAVLRYTLDPDGLRPIAGPDTIVSGLPADRSHTAKSIVVSADGMLYVNIGSPTNSCQARDRQNGEPGIDPCPQLETRAGIWRFDARRVGQTQSDGERFATGIRNAVAITIDPDNGRLYAVQHGRDQLAANWRTMFDDEKSANKPGEELFAVEQGDDFGWPYCYYDPELNRKVLAPEYGGDGQNAGRCADVKGPLFVFPAHIAPNAILFYRGTQFPLRYRQGAFVAFHGSWNRAPLPQAGYFVAFLPFNAGAPLTSYETFADGFAGAIMEPGSAEHRPVGLATGPEGSLYITDDVAGRIWRVFHQGGN